MLRRTHSWTHFTRFCIRTKDKETLRIRMKNQSTQDTQKNRQRWVEVVHQQAGLQCGQSNCAREAGETIERELKYLYIAFKIFVSMLCCSMFINIIINYSRNLYRGDAWRPFPLHVPERGKKREDEQKRRRSVKRNPTTTVLPKLKLIPAQRLISPRDSC